MNGNNPNQLGLEKYNMEFATQKDERKSSINENFQDFPAEINHKILPNSKLGKNERGSVINFPE
jgi:hypothetical protein